MPAKPSRRLVLGLLGGGLAALVAARAAVPWFLRARPIRPLSSLSDRGRRLVEAAFADVDRAALWDAHAHLVGLGRGGTGCWIDPAMRSHLHPVRRLRYEAYLAASGVRDEARADSLFLERLLALHRGANPAGKLVLLAFDQHVDEEGREVAGRSPFHTPDEYVLRVAAEHPDVRACASVHPYRGDATARLERAAEAGAVAVKWLPNAMGIDPASPRCDAFYRKLAELDLPLISHAGVERAVHAPEAQELGNPLRLRRALEAGVRVVVAHCAGLGEGLDLDAPATERRSVSAFELFLRLMGESAWEGRLFGEISAVTLINRCGDPLRELLAARELHPRLVNGSDYPLVAIDPLVSTRLLAHRDLIDPEERAPLEEVYDANPLLFDFVLKRRLRVERGGDLHHFAPTVFESRRVFA